MTNLNEFKLIKKVGNISKTSKMNCYSYNFISAFKCFDIRKKEGLPLDNICNDLCYGSKGRYRFHKEKHDSNENKYKDPNWVNNFSLIINEFLGVNKFRFNDTGDITNILQLIKIGEIALQCPQTKFWLSTRRLDLILEYWTINNKVKLDKLIPNLAIRLSFDKVDHTLTKHELRLINRLGICYSIVKNESFNCKAKANNNNCGICSQCFDNSIKEISYYVH